MDKVNFGNDSKDQGARMLAKVEKDRSDNLARDLSAIRRRINELYNKVDYVVFPDVGAAPEWASNWRDYLLTGAIPAPVPTVEETEDEQTD